MLHHDKLAFWRVGRIETKCNGGVIAGLPVCTASFGPGSESLYGHGHGSGRTEVLNH